MRVWLCSFVMGAAFCAPVVSSAETITLNFIPVGRSAAETISFTSPATPDGGRDNIFFAYNSTQTGGSAQFTASGDLIVETIQFLNAPVFGAGGRIPPLDFVVNYHTTSNSASDLVQFFGAKLYSGSELSPTLLPGDYTITDAVNNGGPANTANVSIRATPAVSAAVAPEPSSILMLTTGVAGIAGVTRRRYWAKR